MHEQDADLIGIEHTRLMRGDAGETVAATSNRPTHRVVTAQMWHRVAHHLVQYRLVLTNPGRHELAGQHRLPGIEMLEPTDLGDL